MKNNNIYFKNKYLGSFVLVAILLSVLAIGSTLAYLSSKDEPIKNEFLPSIISCEIYEEFDKENGIKRNINVKNTGNIDAYIRIKLVPYRINEKDEHIGGYSNEPYFMLNDDWKEYNGYYYYLKKIGPNEYAENSLTDYMKLVYSYDYEDYGDGGRQAIDIMAEAIQALPENALKEAWGEGFSISEDGTLVLPNN